LRGGFILSRGGRRSEEWGGLQFTVSEKGEEKDLSRRSEEDETERAQRGIGKE
jgi:hypothetical protein